MLDQIFGYPPIFLESDSIRSSVDRLSCAIAWISVFRNQIEAGSPGFSVLE